MREFQRTHTRLTVFSFFFYSPQPDMEANIGANWWVTVESFSTCQRQESKMEVI